MEEKSHGILLSSISYLGRQKILKVFTAETGFISLIAKSSKSPQITSPFCIAEWVYRKSQKEMFPLVDATLIDPLSALRSSYEVLTAAGSIARDLLHSQLPSKQSPLLYELVVAYMQKLPLCANPQTLAASFRLKLLLHDGLLSLTPVCAQCKETALILLQGESYCPTHGIGGTIFTEEEWQILLLLGYSRQFSILDQVDLPLKLLEKTRALFEERM